MFPLMPAEVFDEWLGRLISQQGWPFVTVEDVIEAEDWHRIFLERSLAEWASYVWRLAVVEEVAERLSNVSRNVVMQLMMHGSNQGQLASSVIRDSESRYLSARDTMVEIKGFPGFATAYEDSRGKLWVVDGHHRLAALTSFRGYRSINIPFWIATSPKE